MRTFHFPGAMADGLRRIPGIAEVQPVHVVRLDFRGGPSCWWPPMR